METEKINWAGLDRKAGVVFTPTAPIDAESLFAGRKEQVRAIIDVINQKGQHAILYGERGVGKTSLANILRSKLSNPVRQILAPRVNCDSTDNFKTAWKKIFDRLHFKTEQMALGFGREPGESMESGAGLLKDDVTPESVRGALARLANQYVPIFIFDEFDRLATLSRRAFADTIKTLSDQAIDATIILVGVADSVEQLIEEHQSVERALIQVRMPRMVPDEIEELVRRGIDELEMAIENPALARIKTLSQGLPHYAHLLALHACRAAIDDRSTTVALGHVDRAIDKAVKGTQQSIQTDYDVAVRSSRKDNLFSDVLLACAMATTNELGFFAAQDVREPFKRITGKQYEIPSFARHLNEFCDAKRGPILQKIGMARRFRYRFLNPLLQPYVIMRGLRGGKINNSLFQ